MDELTTAEANRRYYAEIAETYDATEECVVERRLGRRLRAALDRAVAELPPSPRVLDACGGSGNVSLLLYELGMSPATVDVSPEMLAIYERAARERRFRPETHLSEVNAFLDRDPRTWDLIVFSSALHHLDDYERTLQAAVARLAPGGIVLTIFDPTKLGAAGRALRRLDYLLHVIVRTPRRVPAAVAQRISRQAVAGAAGVSLGEQAERHALDGIDDLHLRDAFRADGLDVLVHDRYYEGRFGVTRLAYRLLRQPSSFHFLVRRPRGAADKRADDKDRRG